MGCRCVLGLPLVFRLRRVSCVMCVVVSHWVAQSGLGHSEQGLRTPSCLCNTPQFGSFPHQYPLLHYLLPEQCPAQTPGVPPHTVRWWWSRALHYCSSLELHSQKKAVSGVLPPSKPPSLRSLPALRGVYRSTIHRGVSGIPTPHCAQLPGGAATLQRQGWSGGEKGGSTAAVPGAGPRAVRHLITAPDWPAPPPPAGAGI